jgi:hypothetical protein
LCTAWKKSTGRGLGSRPGTFTVIVVRCAAEYSFAWWQVEQTLDVGA